MDQIIEPAAPAAADAAFHSDQNTSVVRHPNSALFDRTVEAVLPAIRSFAIAKNVPLDERDVMPAAEFAVRNISRRTMRGVMELNADAIKTIRESIGRALDILCVAKFIVASFEGREADMPSAIILASQLLADNHANDRERPHQRWPDMSDMVAYGLRLGEAMDGQVQTLTLPEDAIRRCLVKLPLHAAPIAPTVVQEVSHGR